MDRKQPGIGSETLVSRSSLSRERWGLTILLLLVLAAYGRFWMRGGYTDDFYLALYSNSQSYFDAVRHWPQTFNSRISHALILPALYKLFRGNSPAEFNWAGLQALGLVALGLSVYLLDRILASLQVPWRIRTVANLIFVLHPLKAEALLWPAAMTLYVIPLLFFLVGTWLYLGNARQGRETAFRMVLPFCLFLFAALSVEQFLPLLAIVLAVRIYLFPPAKAQLFWNLFGFALISAIFVSLVIFGPTTARRLTMSGWIDLAAIPNRILEVLAILVAGLVGYRHRTLLDGHHWRMLTEAVTTAPFLLGLLLLVTLAWQLWKWGATDSEESPRRAIVTMGVGGLILMGTVSPFLPVNYGLSARGFYIPLLGAALMAGAAMELLCGYFSRSWQQAILVAGLLGIGISCLVVSSVDQDDFSSYWSMEKELVLQLQSAEGDIPPQARVSLVYFPPPQSQAPNLVDDFSFHKMLEWIAPAKHLSGSSLTDLSEIFRLPSDLAPGETVDLQTPPDHWVLLWSDLEHRVIRLKTLRLTGFSADAAAESEPLSVQTPPDSGIEALELDATMAPLSTQALPEARGSLDATWKIELPQLDLASFHVRVRAADQSDYSLRLIARADYDDGSREYAYSFVSSKGGFFESGGALQKSVFVGRISKVRALQISVRGLGVNLSTLQVPIHGRSSNDR